MVTRTSIEKVIVAQYEMAVTSAHFLANISDSPFKEESLTNVTQKAINFAVEVRPGLIHIIINYKAK